MAKQPQQPTPEPRNQFRKFRVNQQEAATVDVLAKKAGMKISDYLRSLVGLSPLTPGAPIGNKNQKRKPK